MPALGHSESKSGLSCTWSRVAARTHMPKVAGLPSSGWPCPSQVGRMSWQRQASQALSHRDLSPFEARQGKGWEQGDRVAPRWSSEEDSGHLRTLPSHFFRKLSWMEATTVPGFTCHPMAPDQTKSSPRGTGRLVGESMWTHQVCSLQHITSCC